VAARLERAAALARRVPHVARVLLNMAARAARPKAASLNTAKAAVDVSAALRYSTGSEI
jgi:hypothetical protein